MVGLGLCILAWSPAISAQPVSFNGERLSVSQAFASIEEQTDYRFAYDSANLDMSRVVYLDYTDTEVIDVVNDILAGTGFKGVIDGNYIVISPAGQEPVQLGGITLQREWNVTMDLSKEGLTVDPNGRYTGSVQTKTVDGYDSGIMTSAIGGNGSGAAFDGAAFTAKNVGEYILTISFSEKDAGNYYWANGDSDPTVAPGTVKLTWNIAKAHVEWHLL